MHLGLTSENLSSLSERPTLDTAFFPYLYESKDKGKAAGGVRPHLHTYSSRGGWVLGVMIQGAMRKATVSVKRGTSGRVWGGNED